VDAAPGLQTLFARYIHQLTTRLVATIARPHIAPVTEDYIVYRITRLVGPTGEALPSAALRDFDVVPLLLNEQRPSPIPPGPSCCRTGSRIIPTTWRS